MEECHLPGLGVALTLDYKPGSADKAVSPLVSYVSGLLLGTNSKVRTWFGMFIRNGQQVSVYNHLCSQFNSNFICIELLMAGIVTKQLHSKYINLN